QDPPPAARRAGGPEPAGDAVAHAGQGRLALARPRSAHRRDPRRARLLPGGHRRPPARQGRLAPRFRPDRRAGTYTRAAMVMRNREAAGFLLSILFVGLAALRDVYFGGLFQRTRSSSPSSPSRSVLSCS